MPACSLPAAADSQSARRSVIVGAIAVATCLLLFAVSVLLRSPCVGVADNGDYWRVMRPAGIDHVLVIDEPLGQFVSCRFRTSSSALWSGFTSAGALAWVARYIPWSSSALGPTEMDLRQVGVVYLAVTVAIVAGALRAGAPPVLLAGWVYVLADPGFLLFFNSFYADPAAFLALLGTCLWLITVRDAAGTRRAPTTGLRGLAIIGLAVLGGAAKMQYLLVPALILTSWVSLWLVGERSTHARSSIVRRLTLASLAVLAIATPVHFFKGSGPRFLEVNNYHAVFAGILLATPHTDAVLGALHIPRDFWDLPRQDVWSARLSPDHPVFAELRSLSRWRLLQLYVSDPPAMAAAAGRVAHEFARARPHIRGTFARESGRRPGSMYQVAWQFSRLRGFLVRSLGPVLCVVPVSWTVWLAITALRRRWSGVEAAGLFLLLFAASQAVVVVLGDGFVALEQHLLGMRLALDLLTVLTMHEAVRSALRIRLVPAVREVESPGVPDRAGPC